MITSVEPDVSKEKTSQKIEKSANISMKLHPIDYLIQSYSSSGEPECLLGISTCSDPSSKSCHTILGKTFLKSFDTILDYQKNEILMRTTPKTKYRGGNNLCWKIKEKVSKKSILEQLSDEVNQVDDFFQMLSDPVTFVEKFIGIHMDKWIKFSEFAGIGILVIAVGTGLLIVGVVAFIEIII